MKYLCLICADLRLMMEHLPEAQAAKHFEEYREFTEEVRRNGQYIGSNRLLPPDAATTIRVRNGKVSVTDGPFAETKEQIGGYYVIEARDLNEAIHIASKIPGARFGCVEIRPIAQDAQTLRALGFAADTAG
ncbi:MAG: YciI family protein [Betaproteobacteria bacterium]|nr:YciI family protein [Betaproteobacteria bacterium]